MLREAYERFSNMLFKESEKYDVYIPELNTAAFRYEVEKWLSSEHSLKQGYAKHTQTARSKGTLLYKTMEVEKMLDIIHDMTLSRWKDESDEEHSGDIEDFCLLTKPTSDVTPSELLLCMKELRKRLQEQKIICRVYGR